MTNRGEEGFVFDGQTTHALGPFQFGDTQFSGSVGYAINDAGHIVGLTTGVGVLFMLTESGVSWLAGAPYLFYGFTDCSLNNADVLVGSERLGTFGEFYAGVRGTNEFGAPIYVSDGGATRMHAVNDSVVAVGATALPQPQAGKYEFFRPRACLVNVGGDVNFIDLRDPGPGPVLVGADYDWTGALSEAFAINNVGHVVGDMSLVAGDAVKHAFRYVGAELENLGTLGGAASTARDINLADQVVGWSTTAGGETHAFLWQNGVMMDLNTLLPAGSGWVLTKANAINEAGTIVGEGQFQGASHAFLLSSLTGGVPPCITGQPTGATLSLLDGLTLAATAIGTGPLHFQWQKDNADLPGETGTSLVLTGVTAFTAGGYRAVVTNSFGTTITATATVAVNDPQLAVAAAAVVTVIGAVGAQYRLDYVNRVNATNWQPVTALTLTNATQLYVDLASITNHPRFYRAVRLP